MQSKREAYGAIDGIYKDPVLWREKAYVPEVRCAILGNNAGIIGAAGLIALVS